jgi:hypothetical protein
MMSNILKIKSVTDLGLQLTDNCHNMVGQDGAYSIPLNGDTLWFFGDTLIGVRTPGESLWYPGGKPVGPKDMSGMGGIEKMINNTGLVTGIHSGRNGLNKYNYILDENGNIKPLIRLLPGEDPDEVRVWCLHGAALGEKIYLFFVKVEMIEEGIFPVNFNVIGSGIAVGNKKDWEFSRIFYNGSDLLWKEHEPKFASAVLKDTGNNMLYLYGVVRQDGVQNCYLAKVPPESIEDISQYMYYMGRDEWSKELKHAVPVFNGMPNELSVSYNKYLKQFLAVHSHDLSGNIAGRTSPSPWGPWSDPVVLHSVKVKREKELPYPVLIYAGKEHPSLAEEDGRVLYITYIEFEEYYPHMVRVELG